MKVTDVRMRKLVTDSRMKALASITLDEAFVIHDLRVIDGNNGLFVAMPSKRTSDGEFRDIAHPINSEMRQEIQEAVMKVYDETEAVEPGTSAIDVADSATSEVSSQLEESDSDKTLSEDLKA
ncbi:septation regulator SpoVG [Macrococcoides caseolyticum]|uniref:septation regulator SpoVG n=1 Tax=Macrococcoides caseolyticum TaxID=69966 RepID=UPI000C334DC0|nr:septation regulator SpoVG [Macrococcus caseolyticus]MDJ1089903.1 septation regulator SpoVG [Macrococcus caseolyticus]MDJ1092027.1 septation regulator SpoVG [Macrococcus caseolyticus]MDJ1154404.1 septation regulator SpoVG [Macrococcus caseolyticus]MDJ1156354.1 septation regulator SpoVG [Macrococcus caseolyticus]MEB8172257.1 septation regulator SpoVG [Macrococcus caseolyticus]